MAERAERAKWLYRCVGLVIGAAGVLSFDRFPGGRGKTERWTLAYDAGQTYKVERVVDGDTIVIEPGLHLRYVGIDTPEIGHFDYKNPDPFSLEASETNRQLVAGRQVRLVFGPQKLDRYGRLLATVEVQDEKTGQWIDVCEELLKKGLARRVTAFGPAPDEDKLIRAEEAARAGKLGLHAKLPGTRGKDIDPQ